MIGHDDDVRDPTIRASSIRPRQRYLRFSTSSLHCVRCGRVTRGRLVTHVSPVLDDYQSSSTRNVLVTILDSSASSRRYFSLAISNIQLCQRLRRNTRVIHGCKETASVEFFARIANFSRRVLQLRAHASPSA